MRKLAYKTCIRTLMWTSKSLCQYRNFFYLLIFRLRFKVCFCLAIAVQPILHYVYFTLLLHLRNQTSNSSAGCSKCSRFSTCISGAITFRHSLKLSWMDIDSELYDGRQGLEICALYLVGILIHTDGFEPLVTEGYQSFFDQQMFQKCSTAV